MMPRKRWESSTDAVELSRAFYMRLTNRGKQPEKGRKLTLYTVALCRKVWDEMPWICRVLTDIAELTADGGPASLPLPRPFKVYSVPLVQVATNGWRAASTNPQQLYPAAELVRYEAELIRLGYEKPDSADDHLRGLLAARFYQLACLVDSLAHLQPSRVFPLELYAIQLLRDIAGDPYQPVKFKPEWRTDTVLTLARQMYESREFSAMPILADALQDTGCNNGAILSHCREPGEHVRGCWVVDLVLGRE
jgi:hypothetical protein